MESLTFGVPVVRVSERGRAGVQNTNFSALLTHKIASERQNWRGKADTHESRRKSSKFSSSTLELRFRRVIECWLQVFHNPTAERLRFSGHIIQCTQTVVRAV